MISDKEKKLALAEDEKAVAAAWAEYQKKLKEKGVRG